MTSIVTPQHQHPFFVLMQTQPRHMSQLEILRSQSIVEYAWKESWRHTLQSIKTLRADLINRYTPTPTTVYSADLVDEEVDTLSISHRRLLYTSPAFIKLRFRRDNEISRLHSELIFDLVDTTDVNHAGWCHELKVSVLRGIVSALATVRANMEFWERGETINSAIRWAHQGFFTDVSLLPVNQQKQYSPHTSSYSKAFHTSHYYYRYRSHNQRFAVSTNYHS